MGSLHTYTQGHSNHTISTQIARNAEADASWILPLIKPNDDILDVGCGPGSITIGFTRYAKNGTVHGIDISSSVLDKARRSALEANLPSTGPGSIIFSEANILTGLPFPDNKFDVVFASQIFGHLPPPEAPIKALTEIRRVLKHGGFFASRDGIEQHFYPRSFKLDQLWGRNQLLVLSHGHPDADPTGSLMPSFCRIVGFEVDGKKFRLGVGSRIFSGAKQCQFLANRAASQLQPGDPFYQSWIDAGISQKEIQETVAAAKKWAETEDAWFVAIQSEILAWK